MKSIICWKREHIVSMPTRLPIQMYVIAGQSWRRKALAPLDDWHLYCLGCRKSCAPKFVAVWPCSRNFIFLTRAAQRWRTWLAFPWMGQSTLSVSCGMGPSAIASWWSTVSCFVFQKKNNIITFPAVWPFNFFFFFLLSDFLHLLLVDSHGCFKSIMFCLSKKKKILIIAFTSIVLFQSPFFSDFFRVCWFGWLIHEHHVFF